MHAFLVFLEKQDRRWTWLGSVCAWAAVAYFHSRIGWEISFSILYLIPIGVSAWVLGRAGGVALSILSAGAWWYANRNSPVDPEMIRYWNGFVRLMLFFIVSELLFGLRAALERERALARTDPLTGLANSRSFTEIAEREIAVARRTGRSLSVIWIDLDGFKLINDQLGHAAGDQVLAQVGAALRRSTRRTDLAARVGGDEFAILLPETDMTGTRVIMEKIVAGVAENVIVDGSSISMSVGAIACDESLPELDEILHRADALMYEVKRAGKGATRIEQCPAAQLR